MPVSVKINFLPNNIAICCCFACFWCIILFWETVKLKMHEEVQYHYISMSPILGMQMLVTTCAKKKLRETKLIENLGDDHLCWAKSLLYFHVTIIMKQMLFFHLNKNHKRKQGRSNISTKLAMSNYR